MGFIRWIIGFVIALALAIFTSANLHFVKIYPSPIHAPIDMPLYLITLSMMAIGFILGALIVWFSTIGIRYTSHKQKRAIKDLENQLKTSDNTIVKPRSPLGDFFPALPRRNKNND